MSTHKIKGEDHYQCREIKAERDALKAQNAELVEVLENSTGNDLRWDTLRHRLIAKAKGE